jgi:hypothetical protein
MTVRRWRGPRNHYITTPDKVGYSWSRELPPTGPWKCECGATGDGQDSAERHLTEKAKAAWKRLDDMHAWAAALVSVGPHDDVDAIRLLSSTRHWFGHPGLRRYLSPFYDQWGTLSAVMDWPAAVGDLEAGKLTGEETDLLVFRIAASLAGVAVPLKLSQLWRLPDDDTRTVRKALLKQLQIDGEQ